MNYGMVNKFELLSYNHCYIIVITMKPALDTQKPNGVPILFIFGRMLYVSF